MREPVVTRTKLGSSEYGLYTYFVFRNQQEGATTEGPSRLGTYRSLGPPSRTGGCTIAREVLPRFRILRFEAKTTLEFERRRERILSSVEYGTLLTDLQGSECGIEGFKPK
jgi:hypothetical protein